MAIALVQIKTAAGTSLTLNSATTAGNCLVVGFTDEGGATTVSAVKLGGVADNFAQLIAQSNTSGKTTELAALWADPSCAGGQTAVAVTPGSAANSPTMWAAEFSGIVASSPLDKSSGSTSVSGSWTSGTTATTTQAVELWLGAVCAGSTSPTGPGAPWNNTSVADSSADTQIYGYQIVSSTGTATYSGTGGGTGGTAAVVATLKGAAAGPAGTVQPRPALPPARRRRLRALLQFTPVATTNAAPAPPVSGTVQPAAALPAPRRRPGRALLRFTPVATANAVPRIAGTVQPRPTLPPARRRRQRARTLFTPVATTNAHRQLIISLASQAGNDDYGNTFPQGILATAGTIEGPTLIGSDAFFYNPSPGFGNLSQSVTEASGTDAYGNAYIAGTATYANNGSFWSAVVVDSGVVTWYMATGPGGPWTSEAGIGFNFNAITGGGLQFTGPAGNGMTGDLNVTGSVTVSVALTVNGTDIVATLNAIHSALSGASTSTNGLPNGTITGTSGAASAGTAHTHGGGSYSVTNGQHSHTLPTF